MAKPARELPQMHRPSPVSPLAAPIKKGAPAKQQRQAVIAVSGRKLAAHLDLSLQRITQLTNIEHVITKLPDGRYDQDDCRVRYLRWLRDPERRSARSKADAEFTKAKAELIHIRIQEKRNTLMPTEIAVERMKLVIFTFVNKLTGIAPRLAYASGNTFGVRREIDAIIHETRKELGALLNKWADEAGEPPITDNTEEEAESVA
jgi:hypothetical protein